MRIAVYDVAASASGALSVLEEFYSEALGDNKNEYLFLISTPELEAVDGISVSRFPWVKKSWLHRLWFDYVVGPREVRRWRPDRILSLQNTIMPRVQEPQVVYEHNCLPKAFCDYSFSFIKSPEMWVRQNIIGFLIKGSLKKADEIVVQSNWMKRRCVERLGINEHKIVVQDHGKGEPLEERWDPCEGVRFFYPATCMPYKRHDLILMASHVLEREGSIASYKIVLTLDESMGRRVTKLKSEIDRSQLPVIFVGWLDEEEVLREYRRSILLFPSELESLGFPLVEAQRAHAPIVAPDLEYAHEVLGSYDRAFFFTPGDSEGLARSMVQAATSAENSR